MKGCNTGQVIDKITDSVILSLAETKCYNNKYHLFSGKKKNQEVSVEGSTGMDRVNKQNQTPTVDPVQV